MKKKTLTQYFEVIKPQYTYLKVVPDTSIRNYNSTNIAKAISHMYKSVNKRIRYEEKHFVIETPVKCSFLIDIRKNSVDFYFVIPIQYVSIIKEKIREVWSKVTIEEVEEIENMNDKSLKYQLGYRKEDPLSLSVDKKSNDPLNSILSVLDIMQGEDRICVFYNFIPTSQFPWHKQYTDTIQKVKNKLPVEREKLTPSYIFKISLTYLVNILEGIMEVIGDFMGAEKQIKDKQLSLLETAAEVLNNNIKLSPATLKKKDSQVIDTQLLVLSSSIDETRKNNNAVAVCQAYRSIEEDNELIYKKINNKNGWHVNDFKIFGADINKVSVEECQNFIQLPGRELLLEHKIISHLNTLETQVPQELRTGTKLLGTVKYKEQNCNSYLTSDKDYKNLAVAIIGPTRSGKTSFMGNLARNSVDAGECVIVLDYIENCGLSDDIKKCIPNDKVLEINLHDYKNLQGLGYNEAITEAEEVFLQYESAKKQTSQLITLINSINIDNSDFTPKMERYLNSASIIVFIQNGAIKDVFSILLDYKTRAKFINGIPEKQKQNLEEYISYLSELDEWSKETKEKSAEIIGSKLNNIVGIIDRINKLKNNTYMELMLKKDCSNNLNLLDEMEKNQAIFIKMPESMFSTAEERDIMTTYWLTKIWMAAQVRAWKITDRYKRKTVNVFTDEIAQLKSAEQFVGSKLDQTAKFGVKFIISTMYINQLRIREKLRTANTSYILISGSDKVNFNELKEELGQFGFTLEDLMNLERYRSLNYIKYEKGYSAFISKLPQPLK